MNLVHWKHATWIPEEFLYVNDLILTEVEDKSGTLLLRTNNQRVVNVPPDCTLSIVNQPVNGKVLVIVEGESDQSRVAFQELNKLDTTAPTKA